MQTGPQERSPIEGKRMNCGQFGTYEPEASRDPCAAMCHGGSYNDDSYDECPVKAECRQFTIERKHRLPIVVEDRKPLVTPPPRPEERRPFMAPPFKMPDLGGPPRATTASVTPTPVIDRMVEEVRAKLNEVKAVSGLFPGAVIPPPGAPAGMRTPYAAPAQVPGGVSPTFLPNEGESVWMRLLKNILQGLLAAFGWHVFDYSRTIDLFT